MLVPQRLKYLLLLITILMYAEQGSMTTDDTDASRTEASLSGVEAQEEMDLRIEEVQLEEDREEGMPENTIEQGALPYE